MDPLPAIFITSLGTAIMAGLLVNRLSNKIDRKSLIRGLERLSPGLIVSLVTNQKQLEILSQSAGLSIIWTSRSLMTLKRLLLWSTILLLAFLNLAFDIKISQLVWLGLPLVYLSLRGPEIYCALRNKKRRSLINRELPRLIDSLLLYVRAGLNLEGAMREFASRSTGLWKGEWQRIVSYLDQGMPFQETLKKLTERFPSDEFRRFAGILEQSRMLGVPLTETLTIHSDLLRAQRKQKAEELAKTASVKISFPLVFFVFPALMIVFLGPAVIQLMQAFQ